MSDANTAQADHWAEFSASEADAQALQADVKAAFKGFETAKDMRIPVAVHVYCAAI